MLDDTLVPLTLAEWEFATRCSNAAYSGAMPLAAEAVCGNPIRIEGYGTVQLVDNPLNRAGHAAFKSLDDDAKGRSFLWRSMIVMPVVTRRQRYRRMIDKEKGMIRTALMKAVCTVRGSLAMSERQIDKAVWAEFQRHVGEES